MANRLFNQFRLSLEKQVVDLFATVTFGASGAPTLVTARSKGIASIVKEGPAGLYTITLSDRYVDLLMAGHIFVKNNVVGPSAPNMYVTVEQVDATTPIVQIEFTSGATATNPDSGDEVRLQFTLSNSTAF